ncbi:MAG: hypothetical protein RRZ84_06050 [Romboutsia sp.]
MKYRSMLDSIVYVLSPIMLCNFIDIKYLIYSITILLSLVLVYSILTKIKEERVNILGIVFVCLCIILSIIRKESQNDFQIYTYDTYFLSACGLTILLFSAFGKNLSIKGYFDIMRSNGYNILNIANNIKKRGLESLLNKLSLVVTLHLITISSIKMYSILIYRNDNYTFTSQMEILVSTIFLLGETYLLSKIISRSNKKVMKESKKDKNKVKNRVKAKITLNDSRVISLSQYKKANK